MGVINVARDTSEITSHGCMPTPATMLKLWVPCFNYAFIVVIIEKHGQEASVINLKHLPGSKVILTGSYHKWHLHWHQKEPHQKTIHFAVQSPFEKCLCMTWLCPVHLDIPTNLFCIIGRFQSLILTGNCSACAHEVHNCAGTPVIQTDTFSDRQVNIIFISLQYQLFPQPGYYTKHKLLQYSILQQIKGLLKYESLNILHQNVCILAKC